MAEPTQGRGALFAGGLAAILASTCCLGPLVLITLGVSGAWIANLTVLEPFRPIFIGAALMALFFAWRRIRRPAVTCQPGEACALPQVKTTYKALFWLVAALVVKKAFGNVAGVAKTEVNLDKREATVNFDDSRTNVDALTRATRDAGYSSTLVGSAK